MWCRVLDDWPGDRLRNELAGISAALSGVGDKLARLSTTAFAQTQNGLPSTIGIRRGWRVVEAELRGARDAVPLTSPNDEILRLRAAGIQTHFQVSVVTDLLSTISPTTQNAVNKAARTKDGKEVIASVRKITRKLKAFCEKCVPTGSDEVPFRAYFERVWSFHSQPQRRRSSG
jgi:hypothetical protein